MCTNLNLTDMENGYKVFRSNVIKKFKFFRKKQIWYRALKSQQKLQKKIKNLRGGRKAILDELMLKEKKITWKDGLQVLRCIIYYNFFGK